MKNRNAIKWLTGRPWLLLGCISMAFTPSLLASQVASVKVQVEPSSQYSKPYTGDVSGDPSDADDTGFQVLNLSDVAGSVSMTQFDALPPLNVSAPKGFKLLDTSLLVSSTLPTAGRRLQIRYDFGRYNLRRAGIRAGSLRLLRADIRMGRWIPAIRAIRDLQRADIRYIDGGRADLKLGHHGIDHQNQYVWAVLDTSGDQYFALAGSPVPVPAAGALLFSGLGALVLLGRARRRER